MSGYHLNDLLSSAECLLCGVALIFLLFRKQARQYLFFAIFLAVRLFSDVGLAFLIAETRHTTRARAAAIYDVYFYVYWSSYALEAILLLLVIYGIYRLAMAPLDGLQRLGNLIFLWIASISAVVSIGFAVGPHVTSRQFWNRVITQLQQTSSMLTLCLLLFVCFAIRPMGLSYRSRVFGISLGLGVLATANLVGSAWIVNNKNMYSPLSTIEGLAICASFVIWTLYLIAPEPRRRIIVLPTTSPFLRWNQISLALGDEPGYVAVAGIPPEMFAEAEIEIMTRASRKMADLPRRPDFASQISPAHLASLSLMGTPVPTSNPGLEQEVDQTLVRSHESHLV